MGTLPIDTSTAGFTSGSVDRQDDTYRNRERPKPLPLIHSDEGYGSAEDVHSSSLQSMSSSSLFGLANSVKCDQLLKNGSNFAAMHSY